MEIATLPHLGFITATGGGIGGLFLLVINVLATIRAIQETRGSALPLWLLFIWLIPCIGGIVALVAIPRTGAPPV